MALACRPEILLCDEPTTALDVTIQAEVMAILDELRRSHGLAMLFITHDLDLAAAICDRTIVMYAGQVVEVRRSLQAFSPWIGALAEKIPVALSLPTLELPPAFHTSGWQYSASAVALALSAAVIPDGRS